MFRSRSGPSRAKTSRRNFRRSSEAIIHPLVTASPRQAASPLPNIVTSSAYRLSAGISVSASSLKKP